MNINQELKLSIIINQNKMILDKLEKIEKRLDNIEKSTTNMDDHIEEINSIYSNYKGCLDFITNKYESWYNSLKYLKDRTIPTIKNE
jgi:uncharacterized coiled-coil protein SlyX